MPGFVGAQIDDHQLISNNPTSYFSLSSENIGNGSVCRSSNRFWSKHRDGINHNQLQKFWSELSSQARQDLLKIDKQTLFEQARKNMYCSRCNGLLLEGFMQIVMYGKSLQHDGGCGMFLNNRLDTSKNQINGGTNTTATCQDETQDPSVHPWGGLITTKDGALTLLDSYLYSKSLKGLQNVFDSARARERERELLYPDACGGGGRGWISHGMPSYGRGHGTRETCALHTARLSCDTLVDFWSALGEETRQSLLKMKEEDFIERLMYRFDSKRFCRDCRRNVIREFKELKELKRMRREPRCTSWFCVADIAFQYEVSNDTIYADWHQTFADSIGTYHHFEWAVGSGEGKSDILEFENVGMNGNVQVDGLDLAGLTACFITLKAWKLDGRCTEYSVKAHALKERECVHCRLVVGDGYVMITRGESIRRFFEHAEEAEEEEDDDSMDKDGNDMDVECSRPQKHAKSPELAREFLLDAATVIFKEQVEKAFREGTARQNAHSIFVCLALKLLEERIQVACKEIITLEKQIKLLEEEEKEKREEEERKERKRTKEREKKLRRKERMRGKDKDEKCNEPTESPLPFGEISMSCIDEDANVCMTDPVNETDDTSSLKDPVNGADTDFTNEQDESGLFEVDSCKGPNKKWSARPRRHSTDNGIGQYKSEHRFHDDLSENILNGVINGFCRQSRVNVAKLSPRNNGPREFVCDMPKPVHRAKKFSQADYARDSSGRARREFPYTKKVWEPVEPQKRFPRSNLKIEEIQMVNSTTEVCPSQIIQESPEDSHGGSNSSEFQSSEKGFSKDLSETKEAGEEENDFSATSSSSSDNCSSCLSEGDSNSNSNSNGNITSSNHPVVESSSSTSDSEDSSQQSEERESSEAARLTPLTENPANGKTGSVQQGPTPSIHNQNISFPNFQAASTVGYYHQTPVAWSTAPANGMTTYTHPNHYLMPSPFGYLPYGPLQHLPSPPFTGGNPIPIYQPSPRTNGELRREYVGPAGNHPAEVSSKEDSMTKLEKVSKGFSLFQYGGPVVQSSGDGKGGAEFSCCRVEGEHGCGKKESAVEEYKLFSARNGLQFSIF